ncbi:MCA1, partial [Symbiodinium microadriaticum]
LELLNSPEVSSRPGGAIIVHYLASYADDFRNMDILRWIRNLSLDPKHLHVCAGMSDVARLEVMFKYGGIYMDTDFLPDRPFADYGDLFRWPFVTHKVCGINIINSILSFDKQSAFLDFALNAYRENCKTFRNCMPEGGAGPPFMAMAILRWNSSEIALIGQQFFHDSRSQIVSHLTENSWGQR